jgi:hypothetical protein
MTPFITKMSYTMIMQLLSFECLCDLRVFIASLRWHRFVLALSSEWAQIGMIGTRWPVAELGSTSTLSRMILDDDFRIFYDRRRPRAKAWW